MLSGDSPDGTGATVRFKRDGLFATVCFTVPVGGSPTGAGKSPALPIFQTRSEESADVFLRAGMQAKSMAGGGGRCFVRFRHFRKV